MSMSVEMVLRLIDQATGPLRGVENELGKLKKTADKLNETQTAGKVRASVWMDQQKGLQQAREEAERYEKQMTRLNATQSAAFSAAVARGLERAGTGLFQAEVKALETAREHQRVMQSIATAGGIFGHEGALSKGVMEASAGSGVSWRDIAEGEPKLVSLGGGEYVAKIAGIRTEVAKLAKASETETGELYNAIFHYMHLGHMSAQGALDQLKVNFLQGQKGAYELKDLAHGLPSLLALGKTYGMTGAQIGTDIPALLQILRKTTGTPGEADTRLRHIITKLTDPQEAKKINKELGVDIYKTRERAIKAGADPLISTLDAISAALDKAGGKLNHATQEVEGADVRKLGAIARDYYFRAGIEAFTQMRGELDQFRPSIEEARRVTQRAFDANMSTADAVHEKAAQAWSAMAIKAATPWLELDKKVMSWSARAANTLGEIAEKNPTGFAAGGAAGVLGLWAGAGFMARQAILKGAEIWGEGLAKASGGAAAEAAGGGLLKGVLKGSVTGLIASSLWGARHDIEAAITGGDAQRIRDTDAFLLHRIEGRHDGEAARGVFERMRQLHQTSPTPIFTQAMPTAPQTIVAGPALPTFAALHGQPGAGPGDAAAKPHVDTSEMKAAADEARQTGEQIRQSLSITATPTVDASGFSSAQAAADRLLGTIRQIGSASGGLGAQVSRGVAAGSHSLHDGPEAH